MYFPENGSKIPEEQKQIVFSWPQFVQGMQPYIDYRYYFRLTGTKTIEKHLLRANSITINISDLVGLLGLSEGDQYNWEVRAVQHTEGDDRLYYGLVNNPSAQYGTRVQVVSQSAYFNIIPKASPVVVPFVVPDGDPLFGFEPIKPRTDLPPTKATVEELAGSSIPGAVPKGSQPQPQNSSAGVTTAASEDSTNYTPLLIGAAIIAAIFFFVD